MIRVEFHCHTARSHDAFTTEDELAAACADHAINVVTITEHDLFALRDFQALKESGVTVVHGCEFTCELGTHIIGLFLTGDLGLSGQTAVRIVKGIREVGGLVYIPHPFKPGSGYFTRYSADTLLDLVDLMELYNGGFPRDPNLDRIRALAQQHDIRLVAGSDSHARSHVGFYVSEYEGTPGGQDLRQLFSSQNPRMLVDDSRARSPRDLNRVQRLASYQWLVLRVPRAIKHPVKALFARSSRTSSRPARPGNYRQLA